MKRFYYAEDLKRHTYLAFESILERDKYIKERPAIKVTRSQMEKDVTRRFFIFEDYCEDKRLGVYAMSEEPPLPFIGEIIYFSKDC